MQIGLHWATFSKGSLSPPSGRLRRKGLYSPLREVDCAPGQLSISAGHIGIAEFQSHCLPDRMQSAASHPSVPHSRGLESGKDIEPPSSV